MALSIRTYLVGHRGAGPCTSPMAAVTYHQGAGLYTLLPLEEDIMDNRFIGAKTRASRCTASAAARLISDRARQLKSGVSFETQRKLKWGFRSKRGLRLVWFGLVRNTAKAVQLSFHKVGVQS